MNETMLSPPSATHILSLAQTLKGGGVERTLLRLSRGWIGSGRQVTLLLGQRDGPLADEVPEGVDIIEIGSAAFTDLRRLPVVVRDAKPDVIFCPGNHYTSIAGFTRVRLGPAAPPIIAKISNALARPDQGFPLAPAYRWWLRRHPGFIDHFVAMSPAMRDEAIATMRVDPSRISIIANPVTTAPNHVALLARRNGLQDRPLLVGVGRLEPQKRWDRLIDAVALVDNQQAQLVIVGEGSERPALTAQIDRLGLAKRVSLPGYISDPAPYLAGADAVVLTSDFEGVPNVLREALALGTPVVATESSVALREIIAHAGLGSIVPRWDQVALVKALNHWLDPAAVRPAPVAPQGEKASDAYLALFDRLVAERRHSAMA